MKATLTASILMALVLTVSAVMKIGCKAVGYFGKYSTTQNSLLAALQASLLAQMQPRIPFYN